LRINRIRLQGLVPPPENPLGLRRKEPSSNMYWLAVWIYCPVVAFAWPAIP
ncbi:hypothetical protein CEXT_425861, partial [Caerostris extrusa]